MIQMSTIPASSLKPGVYGELNLKSGGSALPGFSQKLLIVGSKTSFGTAAPGTVQEIFSEAEAVTLYGAGSQIHQMVRAALRSNPYLSVSVSPMDDSGSAIAAASSVTITGTATSAGPCILYVGADRIEVAVSAGDSATAVATALKNQVNGALFLPVTASSSAGQLTLTAKNKGSLANKISLGIQTSAAGLGLPSSISMSGGSGDPALQAALDIAVPGFYHVVAFAQLDSAVLSAAKSYAETVSSAIEQRPCRMVFGSNDATLANMTTLSTGTNYERSHIAYARASRSCGWEIAAAVAARIAFETDPALPLNGVSVAGLDVPVVASRFTRAEQESLLTSGITPLEHVDGMLSIVRLVTTRTQNAGSPDLTLLDSGTIACMDFTRMAMNSRMRAKFSRSKLNDLSLDQIVTQAVDVLYRLEEMEILQKIDDYKALVSAERDPNAPGRVRLKVPAPVVPGLHQIFERFDLYLI